MARKVLKSKKKCRKVSGKWGSPINASIASGSGFSNPFKKEGSRDYRRQLAMVKRAERQRIAKESQERKKAERLEKIREQTELAQAIAKKRKVESEARKYHPLRRALSKINAPTTKTKRGKIRWF